MSAARKAASKGGQPSKTSGKTKAGQPKRGRPSKFTQEVADELCARISDGEPLRQICMDAHMPCARTVMTWKETRADFSAAFARARDEGHDAIAESCLEIADDARNDWMERHSEKGTGYELNGEHVQRSKLRVWTRMQLLAKWNPKKYGDRIEVNGEMTHRTMSDEGLIAKLNELGVPVKTIEPEPGIG